jgi:cytochrome P450
MFSIDMFFLHRNPDQWWEPEKFIPERFDPTSKYYLTPKGDKRHHFSFAPFLGGKRICLGKTFVEVVSKVIGPTIIGHFDFDFID